MYTNMQVLQMTEQTKDREREKNRTGMSRGKNMSAAV